MDYLARSGSPLPDALWKEIEDAAISAARDKLTARRFLSLEGPFGLGITAIEVGEDVTSEAETSDRARMILSRAISVPMLQRKFSLSIRRTVASLENGQPLDLSAVDDAAEAVADSEEQLIYYGRQDFGIDGLLNSGSRQHKNGGDWSDIGIALQDVLSAVTSLDEAGYRGPYALVLSPSLYNGLFRLYPGTDVLQIEHMRRLCTHGIYKAEIEGAALIDPRAGVLILGQDLEAGYRSQDGIYFHLYLSESLALRLDDPAAVCTISAANQLFTEKTKAGTPTESPPAKT